MLRGINVSGKNTIKMEALRQMFMQMGFAHIQTHIQTGNVVFRGKSADTKHIARSIRTEIESTFGLDVPTIVLSQEELRSIVEKNPFATDTTKMPQFMHVTFLEEQPVQPDMGKLREKSRPDEAIALDCRTVYLYCPNGYGTTKLNNTHIEKYFKTAATTRNWGITQAILVMAQSVPTN